MEKKVQMPPKIPYAAPMRCCQDGDVKNIQSFTKYLRVALVFM